MQLPQECLLCGLIKTKVIANDLDVGSHKMATPERRHNLMKLAPRRYDDGILYLLEINPHTT
jgi:hypothetical protein